MAADTILVTYASRAGSTAGVAEAIGQTLREQGASVEVRSMQDVDDLTPFRAVVAGSAIQGQQWLPEALQFVETHRAELARKPFATFLVCITLSMKNGEAYRASVADWISPVRALVRPVAEGQFAGALDFKKLPVTFNTLLMRLPVLFGLWQTGDHRDWDAIHAWTVDLLPLLGT
jgi:menaquinone-dependent protoporphyrinogen oxidase